MAFGKRCFARRHRLEGPTITKTSIARTELAEKGTGVDCSRDDALWGPWLSLTESIANEDMAVKGAQEWAAQNSAGSRPLFRKPCAADRDGVKAASFIPTGFQELCNLPCARV